MHLLDTNIVIAFLRNDPEVVSQVLNDGEIVISVITAGEMYFGAQNSREVQKNQLHYRDFFSQCTIIPIDATIAEEYANIRHALKIKGTPIPENDIWIAATAKAKNCTVVTRDKHLLSCNLISSEQW